MRSWIHDLESCLTNLGLEVLFLFRVVVMQICAYKL